MPVADVAKKKLTLVRVVPSGGTLVEPVTRANVAPPKNTVKLKPMAPADFRVTVAAPDGHAVVRAISGARFAKWLELEVEVKDGHAVVPEGYAVMVATHRHGRIPATPQAVILHDWGTWRGALATTLSHDSHNLVVYGHDPAEMALAANTVIDMDGGCAVVKRSRKSRSRRRATARAV